MNSFKNTVEKCTKFYFRINKHLTEAKHIDKIWLDENYVIIIEAEKVVYKYQTPEQLIKWDFERIRLDDGSILKV